jgi:hypothetical protein
LPAEPDCEEDLSPPAEEDDADEDESDDDFDSCPEGDELAADPESVTGEDVELVPPRLSVR